LFLSVRLPAGSIHRAVPSRLRVIQTQLFSRKDAKAADRQIFRGWLAGEVPAEAAEAVSTVTPLAPSPMGRGLG